MKMKAFLVVLLSAVFSISSPVAFAEDGASLFATCGGCHGFEGQGNPELGAPALAGQLADYTVRQLNNFKSGLRGKAAGDTGGAQMAGMAAMLDTDAKVQAIAEYVARLPMKKPAAKLKGDATAGRSSYNTTCSDCHGGNGAGNQALSAPNLTGLSDQYLVAQMQKFMQTQRGYEKADRHGRQMGMIAQSFTDDAELRNIAAYIQSLPVAQ